MIKIIFRSLNSWAATIAVRSVQVLQSSSAVFAPLQISYNTMESVNQIAFLTVTRKILPTASSVTQLVRAAQLQVPMLALPAHLEDTLLIMQVLAIPLVR